MILKDIGNPAQNSTGIQPQVSDERVVYILQEHGKVHFH